MKITKYNHSCLLAETSDRVALIDPGVWSWEVFKPSLETVERIDRIVVTHEHPDHMHSEFIKSVLDRFPEAHVVANERVTTVMKEAGIEATYRGSETQCCKPFESPHENLPVLSATPPEETGFHFQDQLSLPGDSHSFKETKEILALPVIAPWGSTTNAVKIAVDLKPKHILPVHDWHYSDEGRQWLYGLLEQEFASHGIKFHKLVNGEPVDI